MGIADPIWKEPADYLRAVKPEESILFLNPGALAHSCATFQRGFDGQTTYAVKANPDPKLLVRLHALGIEAFDVASPAEIELVRKTCPGARLHYHNPVRSLREICVAEEAGVASYSIDSLSEFKKLNKTLRVRDVEVAVRFALPLKGASYDFGSKFGTTPEEAASLLKQVLVNGFIPTLTFHPGTQCTEPGVWAAYIKATHAISVQAGVKIERINVGGGFPCGRDGRDHDLNRIFQTISKAKARYFGEDAPAFVCEPGRALVSDAYSLAIMVKAVRGARDVFLADGIYGTLCEQGQIGLTKRFAVIHAENNRDALGGARKRRVFGPTCDSLDVLPNDVPLPDSISEGDYILFHSLGAYSSAMATRFNGYGVAKTIHVQSLV